MTFDLADTRYLSVRVANTHHRSRDCSRLLHTCIFEKDEFKKSDLETLRGRLIFAESQIFGRLAHKALKQIGADMSSPGRNLFVKRLFSLEIVSSLLNLEKSFVAREVSSTVTLMHVARSMVRVLGESCMTRQVKRSSTSVSS